MRALTKGLLAVALALTVMAAPVAGQSGQSIDRSSDKTPELQLEGTLVDTVERIDDSDGDWTQYEDDSGNTANLTGMADPSVDNPITFGPTKLSRPDAGTFPAATSSTLDADAYTTSGASMAVSDRANTDVGGVVFDGTPGSTATSSATFSDVSVTSDTNKRVLWVAGNVSTLSGSADIVLNDGTGDQKRLHVDSSMSASASDVAATSTGAFIAQVKLDQIAVEGSSGDGTFDAIESIDIEASNGDVTLGLTELSLENLNPVNYGDFAADTDGDNTTETSAQYEATGMISTTGLDSLGDAFTNATVHDYEVQYVDQGQNVEYEWDEERASDYNYDTALRLQYSFSFPDVQDVSLQSAQLTDTVALPTSRLLSAKYIEGDGGMTREELADSTAWEDLSQSYIDAGDNATLTVDSSFQSGLGYEVEEVWLFDDGEKSEVLTDSGGIGVPIDAGGFLGGLTGPFGAIATAVSGWFVFMTDLGARLASKIPLLRRFVSTEGGS